MLGRAVSSRMPTDFQPRSTMWLASFPAMNCQGMMPGPTRGCPYCAVGMQRAADSAIGLPSIPTSASWMLRFWTPAEVRSSFMVLLRGGVTAGRGRPSGDLPPLPRSKRARSDSLPDRAGEPNGPSASGERLGLQRVELRLGDGTGVEQRLGAGDLLGRTT